jgi:acetoacetate decarboxylase
MEMPRPKMIYLTAETHQRLKLLAARRSRTMGAIVAEMVERELADVAGPWTGPDGLLLQQQMLAQAWSDPALDVYDRD